MVQCAIQIYTHFSQHLETMLPNQEPSVKERIGMWAEDFQQAPQALLSRQQEELHLLLEHEGFST